MLKGISNKPVFHYTKKETSFQAVSQCPDSTPVCIGILALLIALAA